MSIYGKIISKTVFLIILFFGFISCTTKEIVDYKPSSLDIIPIPNKVSKTQGYFEVNNKTSLVFDNALENSAHFLNKYIAKGLGYELSNNSKNNSIVFAIDTDIVGIESYRISIDKKNMLIESRNDIGAFYAVQTIRQLLPSSFENETYNKNKVKFDLLKIEDSPRYNYRGFMLDVARHFFSVDDVKHIIDLLTIYKINILHLHLTDDQGWRIEIKSWPNLTEYGSKSSVNNEKGGFYTQEEYIEIQNYALKNHITIIPEIDMPGHINAALSSYPKLNCDNKATEPYSGIKVGFSSLCIKKDITYQFVDDVIREISEITSGDYIHIGGDESRETKEDDYISFINKTRNIVKSYGKEPIGWDEIVDADIESNAMLQFWGKVKNVKLAAKKGAKIIMSPSDKIYLDIKYNDSTNLGLTWAGLNNVEDAYNWEVDSLIEGVGGENIVGIEAPLWTETIVTSDDIEYMLFPRVIGVAEIAWSKKENRNWEEYKKRLSKQKLRLDNLEINYYKSDLVDWK